MQVMETSQTGKRESLADLIAVAESAKTPYSSMLAKGSARMRWIIRGR